MIAVLLAALAPSVLQDPVSGLLEPVEIRALVIRPSDADVLGDPAAIGVAMQRLSEIGFDAVVPIARERGRTLRKSEALAAAGFADASAYPGRDVLAEIVFEAHRAGLEVLVGIDGAAALDPAAKAPEKLSLSGAKDRLDARDPAVRALARAFALELAKAAEIDGFVLYDGLSAFSVDVAESPTKKVIGDAANELAAWREELRAFDKSLVVGWAALDARFQPPADAKPLDFAVFPRGTKDLPIPLAAWAAAKPGRVALSFALDAATPESFAGELAAARAKPFQGELVEPFAALIGGEGALADVLTQGIEAPYYARATLPWRDGVVWRPVVELVDLVDDSGTFTKVEAAIPYATLPAQVHGNASWSTSPTETGPHELWVYLPPSDAELPALEFTVTTDARRARKVVVAAHVPRGWTRVAQALISSTRKEDVLRLAVPEGQARPVAVGPLVALPRRRLDGR